MATPDGAFVRPDAHASSQTTLLPPWLSNSPATSTVRPPSPSVTLSLSPSVVQPSPAIPWLQPVRATDILFGSSFLPSHGIIPCGENPFIRELLECCKELEEKHRAWAAHKKEAAWRLKRVELQLESEKTCKKREKMEEIEAKVKALREEQKANLDRIEAEYRDQLAELKRDADVKEQKLADQWAAKHSRLVKFLEQTGFQPRIDEPNG